MFSARTGWRLQPNALTGALERLRARGARLLDLSASNPTECGFEYDQQTILDALRHPAALHYTPDPRGLLSAREHVARYYAERGCSVDPAQIILTTSTSEAYSFLFRLLCDPGDCVLVPAPSYPLFDLLADVNDVKLSPYRLLYGDGWHVDLPHAAAQLSRKRTRAVVLVHPNNPTGSYIKPAERDALSAMCSERGAALISDEVFLDYAQPGQAQPSFAENAETLTFTLSGLSKIGGLPQMKLAWLVCSGPTETRNGALERLEVISDTFLSMNAPLQHALPVLLVQAPRLQQQVNARIAANLAILDSSLGASSRVSRLRVEGGWYAVLRVPAVRPDEELAVELLEGHGVLVHPGHFYDFPGEGYLVVSLITPEAAFREGIQAVLAVVGG